VRTSAVVLNFAALKHDLRAYRSTVGERDYWRLGGISMLLIMSLALKVIVYDTLLHFSIVGHFLAFMDGVWKAALNCTYRLYMRLQASSLPID
jgi:hypothetical protein